jgi:hypothetical protein
MPAARESCEDHRMLVGLTRSSGPPAFSAYSSFHPEMQAAKHTGIRNREGFSTTPATDDCGNLLFLSQLLGSTISLLQSAQLPDRPSLGLNPEMGGDRVHQSSHPTHKPGQ